MRRWVRRAEAKHPRGRGRTAARDARVWSWPRPHRGWASFTHGAMPPRVSSAWLRPAAEHAGASVTNPRSCPGRSWPGADDGPPTQLAHRPPAGLQAAIAGAPRGLPPHQGGGAVSPEQLLALAASCTLPPGDRWRSRRPSAAPPPPDTGPVGPARNHPAPGRRGGPAAGPRLGAAQGRSDAGQPRAPRGPPGTRCGSASGGTGPPERASRWPPAGAPTYGSSPGPTGGRTSPGPSAHAAAGGENRCRGRRAHV
jgi:hypothetical protein